MEIKYSLLLLVFGAITIAQSQNPYTYVCEESTCLRKIRSTLTDPNAGSPINICKLNCDNLGSLWPKPTGEVSIGKELVSIDPTKVTLVNNNDNPEPITNLISGAFDIFKSYLSLMGPEPNTGSSTSVVLSVSDNSTEISLTTDESYNLTVTSNTTTVTATIQAVTFFGARHGLETLSQLIAHNDDDGSFQIVSTATIQDKPVFKYRGVMLDTSRNYFSIEKIKRLIDGLSYNKLNIFHWHITDSHSFPMEVQSHPNMLIYGPYSPDKIYTKENITYLVAYAKQRGVKIIPELDQPAHSGNGYQWGPEAGLGDLTVCLESEPWHEYCVEPPCGQLNIVNPNVTELIGDIFQDMVNMFGTRDIFHMGGDEVDFRCYKSIPAFVDWMNANGYTQDEEDYFRLWAKFQQDALDKLTNATGNSDTQVILWTSGLTDPVRIETHLDKNKYIIQIWTEGENEIIKGLLEKGYKVIFSNVDALYLDCGFQAWLGNGHNWCSPVKGWQTVYDNSPEAIYAKWVGADTAAEAVSSGQILGSAAPLWTEQVDDSALESRIWPRAAAHAERLWTHPTTNYADAEIRMVTNRYRLVTRGIDADRLQPEFCLQNEGKCYAYRSPEVTTTTGSTTGDSTTRDSTTPDSTTSTTRGGNGNGSPKSVDFSVFVALFAAICIVSLTS
ncbi:unnamed protein product [Orchesella dallaii]|uniref:Beta-hexosaminidase n=1 Tax=Orchesella dallaii TaxID=48710 RepID=A0ABP1RFM7_9HEXA